MAALQVSLCGIPAERLSALSQLLAAEAREVIDHVDVFNSSRLIFKRDRFAVNGSGSVAMSTLSEVGASGLESTGATSEPYEVEQVHTLVVKIRPSYLTALIKIVKGFGVGEHFGSIDVMAVRCTTEVLPVRPNPGAEPVAAGGAGASICSHLLARFVAQACGGAAASENRLSTLEIHTSVMGSCDLNFNHVTCVILACGMAAIGMLTDNDTAVLASFFISPLMQMVAALIWGLCISDFDLAKRGLTNMACGAGICLCFGASVGILMSMVSTESALQEPPYEGPGAINIFSVNTKQILSRGPPAGNILTSSIIAMVCGVAVALGQSSGIQGALAGVALSLALLPPVVNAGMLWSLQVVFPGLRTKTGYLVAEVGLYSIFLYLVNVFAVITCSMVTLKLRRVGGKTLRPMRSRSAEEATTEAEVVRNFRPSLDSALQLVLSRHRRPRAQTEALDLADAGVGPSTISQRQRAHSS